MKRKPSTTEPNGATGRDASGRFARGNKAAKGNPMAARVAQIRVALIEALTTDDVRAIVRALISRAKKGDVAAAREILDRAIGKPLACDILERLAALEQALGDKSHD